MSKKLHDAYSLSSVEDTINLYKAWSKNYDRDFAYKNKAHSEIIKKTKERGWYSEDLFARFNIISQKTKIF